MTCKIDSTGSSPKYWIIYDANSHGFEVIDNQRNDGPDDESYTYVNQPTPEEESQMSECRDAETRRLIVDSAGRWEPDTTVAEAISAYLNSTKGKGREQPVGADGLVVSEGQQSIITIK